MPNKVGLIGNFDIDDSTGCWNWNRARLSSGYGRAKYMGKQMAVSRIVAILYLGLDYRDTQTYALHRCDNPLCINPKHIFLGSHLDNIKDCLSKGRAFHQKLQASRGNRCIRGHLLTPENIYKRPDRNARECLSCNRERAKESGERLRK